MSDPSRKLLLNASRIHFDADVKLTIGTQPYHDEQYLQELRSANEKTHMVLRRSKENELWDIPLELGTPTLGTKCDVILKDDIDLQRRLILHSLLLNFHEKYRVTNRFPLRVESPNQLIIFIDDIACPDWLDARQQLLMEVRYLQLSNGEKAPVLVMDWSVAQRITYTAERLLSSGVDLRGQYIGNLITPIDIMLHPFLRLVGRIDSVQNNQLVLSDTREDENDVVLSSEVYPAASYETLRVCFETYFPQRGNELFQEYMEDISRKRAGAAFYKNLTQVGNWIQKRQFTLAQGITFTIGKQLQEDGEACEFPVISVSDRPIYVFGPDQENQWHDGGLQRFGPYDQSRFSPTEPRIAVICQKKYQGRVETFLSKLLNGTIRTEKRSFNGMVKIYRFKKAQPKIFTTERSDSVGYREAIRTAIADAADNGFAWDLAIVQTEESFHQLHGDDNPYLVSKWEWLNQQVPSQEVELETLTSKDPQLLYICNNIALASYAKMGGTPWLLRANRQISHELVIGLGSTYQHRNRLDKRQRLVGITTVFTGDGRYMLQERTPAVPIEEFYDKLREVMLRSLTRIRTDLNWQTGETVRLVFHSFQPPKRIQLQRIAEEISASLSDFHIEFAFIHVAQDHSWMLIDEVNQDGLKAYDGQKGHYAPLTRGISLKLDDLTCLLVLTSASDLKRPSDGLPRPILLRVDSLSTFRDLNYLAQQVYNFANHSWRGFFPQPLPITNGYSQLAARLVGSLSQLNDWNENALAGKIGTRRWFL